MGFFFWRPSVNSSVRLSVLLLHFLLLRKNHWAGFRQSLHKISVGKGDSSFVRIKGHAFFQREITNYLKKLVSIKYLLLKLARKTVTCVDVSAVSVDFNLSKLCFPGDGLGHNVGIVDFVHRNI